MQCAAIHMLNICFLLFNCKGTWHFVAVLTSAAQYPGIKVTKAQRRQ
jgi:hypothetical protein